MSWASRRRVTYLLGVSLFLLAVFGIPLAIWIYEPPTCTDGRQNQGETAPDRGGPCSLRDVRTLTPPATMWSRSFVVRIADVENTDVSGIYNSAAYVENPNDGVGVLYAPYRFKLYDERNVLVAEREGVTSILPGSITPIFEGQMATGHRVAAHTFFEFTEPLTWERLKNLTDDIEVGNRVLADTDNSPRVSTRVTNKSTYPIKNIIFVAVVFDAGGNAVAASQTALPRLGAGEATDIVFSWPRPFGVYVGRVDVIPVVAPERLE